MPDTYNNIKLQEHIDNFQNLSEYFNGFIEGKGVSGVLANKILMTEIEKTEIHNGFFNRQNIILALKSIIDMLNKQKTEEWINKYRDLLLQNRTTARVGVVMAGNIPLVGFHDFLCVLMCGHVFIGKLSSNDMYLLPALADILKTIDSRYENLIQFTDDKLHGFDAVIATGSNNTSRYFEYYFSKYPHIIRKNRNSLAVISGNENDNQLQLLSNDIFRYFGLGCRNVSKIFLPKDFDMQRFINAMRSWDFIIDHNKYKNNYDYYKTILIMDEKPFIDAGFFMMCEDTSLHAPISVLNYEFYDDISRVEDYIHVNEEMIQCVASEKPFTFKTIPFGKTQSPELWDYADNVDTMKFLLSLKTD